MDCCINETGVTSTRRRSQLAAGHNSPPAQLAAGTTRRRHNSPPYLFLLIIIWNSSAATQTLLQLYRLKNINLKKRDWLYFAWKKLFSRKIQSISILEILNFNQFNFHHILRQLLILVVLVASRAYYTLPIPAGILVF